MQYSFIVPVYNSKTYLSACVESIRAAEVLEYEILLIDDGSTDGSREVCDALAAQYPEIQVIHQCNGGVSAARNRGIREARGEKILFLDADDTIDSTGLAAVLADPRCNEADLIIFGLTFDYYRKDECYRRDFLYFPYDGIMAKEAWCSSFHSLFEANSLNSMCTKVFSRSLLKQYGLELNTNMFLYEDLEFVLRYLHACDRIWNVPQAVYHYRQSEDEGNAKRRLTRVDCLSVFMKPIEEAMNQLSCVAVDQREHILVQLFQTLAREKVSVSTMKQIRSICADYASWYQNRHFTEGDCALHRRLIGGKTAALVLQDKMTALRHKIAVWAKANHLYQRK